jgi:hypothetical protein
MNLVENADATLETLKGELLLRAAISLSARQRAHRIIETMQSQLRTDGLVAMWRWYNRAYADSWEQGSPPYPSEVTRLLQDVYSKLRRNGIAMGA